MLRLYQREAIDSIYSYYSYGGVGNPLIVAPTGSGKSHIIANFCKETLDRWDSQRILILSHVKEILEQNKQKLFSICPDLNIGIYSAGLKQKTIGKVTLAGIQSIYKKPDAIKDCSLILVDEAHLLSRKGESMYRSFISAMRKFNPDIKIIGFTATPYRLDTGLLHQGENAIFSDIIYDISIKDLIRDGYLCNLITKNPETQADLSKVSIRLGEFAQNEAEVAINQTELTHAAINELLTYGEHRNSWLIFCAGIDHAKAFSDALNSRGINSEYITGDTISMLRDSHIRDFREGRLKALCNCMVLTTGFDAPNCDLIALLRPTQSAGLYVQMVGRGLRIAQTKKDCMVLDFAGNIMRHGCIDSICVKKQSNGQMIVEINRVKTCPQCRLALHIACRVCPECGFKFGDNEVHESRATNLPVLSEIQKPECLIVDEIEYRLHQKKNKPTCLRVIYSCGLSEVSEFVCPEHGGYAAQKARQWWAKHGGRTPHPATSEEALNRTNEIIETSKIWVINEGRFDRIVSFNLKTEDDYKEDCEFQAYLDEIGLNI